MARPAWKPADAGTTWTIKGVHEKTKDAVRQAAADAEMLIGDWVDQALASAAREAREPSPPAATKEDVAAILEQLAKFKAAILALADGKASAQDLAEVKTSLRQLAESKASARDLAEVEARMRKVAERAASYDRPAVRHVMVEKKKPARPLAPPRMTDDDPREP